MIPSHTIIFGAITMVEDGANVPDVNGCQYLVQAEGTTRGNPRPVVSALLSLMRQGSDVAYERTDNREPTLRVTIKADDSELLALGERALQLECERPNTLTWIPPDGAGQPSVFDIVWSQIELAEDDLAELRRERTYVISLQALPYARGAELVVTPATVTAVETVVDDGSSATGWTVASGTLAVVSGALVNTFTQPVGSPGVSLWHTAAISFVGAPYVAVTWKTTDPTISAVRVHNGNVISTIGLLYEVARANAGSGYTTSWFQIPTGVTSTDINVEAIQFQPAGGTYTLSIDKLSTWTSLPFIGTAHQKAMSLVPGGSVRTQGSIAVEHETNALGKTVVYTSPAGTGYLPPLRSWRIDGDAVTTDSSLVSGARNGLATATHYAVPASVVPEGRAELWAFLYRATAATETIYSDACSYVNSVALLAQSSQVDVTFVAATWQLVRLGTFTLPPAKVGPAGLVRIGILATADVLVDEAYIFATDRGRLTIVDCGIASPSAGGSSRRLWIDAPSLEQPQGGIWRGDAADRSDAFYAGGDALPWGVHDFDPAGMTMTVVTPNTIDAATSLTHHRRYQTHVADI